MRFVFLLPDLNTGLKRRVTEFIQRHPKIADIAGVQRMIVHLWLHTDIVWGGTLNIMRHALVAQNLGAEVAIATPTGRDTYGKKWGLFDLPFIKWSHRRPNDVVMVPDFATDLVDQVTGPVIAYLQVPVQLIRNFDYQSERVRLWTDSPFMLEKCQEVFPDKEIPIVPNVVDDALFPFVPQDEREAGLIFAFPRKGPDYIDETRRLYRELGGEYWRFELIDGISIKELGKQFSRPQAFLASADVEGCALPPQESMASGVIVVGKNARGANFAMQHRKTAMIADTPAEAAQCLRDAEDAELRTNIATAAYKSISRYFPANAPSDFWRENIAKYGD